MPPQFALLMCFLLILYLFLVDRKKIEGVSKAIWIPLIWMFFGASRYLSQWLNLEELRFEQDFEVYLEGNPLNAASFFILIVAGVIILIKRRLNWSELFTKNIWMWLLFAFGIISFFWSDYPFVSLKRWFKTLGNVVMVLVILTEERPYEAIGIIFRRLAYILLPLSILFIKYYPQLGRIYHMGEPMFIGVAGHKNGLGLICLFSGIYFSWILLMNNHQEKRLKFSIYFIIFPMIIWLLYKANSATALVCIFVVVCLLSFARIPVMAQKPWRVLMLGISCIIILVIVQLLFDAKLTVINLLGRDETLTHRVPTWELLLSMVKDPIFGFGWEGFWLGERQIIVFEKTGLKGNAHNGYLEMYLNLGLVGLFILGSWILSGLLKIARYLFIDYSVSMLRLSFIVVFLLSNWTEASIFGVSVMLMLFLMGNLEMPEKKLYTQSDLR